MITGNRDISGRKSHFTVRGSSLTGAKAGHGIKRRALRTSVINTVLDDGVSGATIYAADFSNGAIQVPVMAIEAAATTPFSKPPFDGATIQGNFTGMLQHLLANGSTTEDVTTVCALRAS